MKRLLPVLRGLVTGSLIGITSVGLLWQVGGAPLASAFDTNIYAYPGVASPACEDWEYDTSYFPGTTTPFNYYWSGQPWWWNDSSVHHCWHNDELGAPNWRAVDYPKPSGTAVVYETTVFASNILWSQSFSSTSGCGGLTVSVWNINGSYAGDMHYWHVTALAGVIGSSWTTYYTVPGQSFNVRNVATILPAGGDGCTSIDAHVHQAIWETSTAVPYRHGDLNVFPDYFR